MLIDLEILNYCILGISPTVVMNDFFKKRFYLFAREGEREGRRGMEGRIEGKKKRERKKAREGVCKRIVEKPKVGGGEHEPRD